MAAGLTALHDGQVIHRDLKPGNVMIVPGTSGPPRVVISDFGLARPVSDSGPLDFSKPGQAIGTPVYMAPEQLTGKPVGPAADIYTFGLILYEMVTGARPFGSSKGLDSATRRLHEEPPPPREVVPELDAQWEAVILECLERDPANRPPSAAEIVAGLDGDRTPSKPSTQLARRAALRSSLLKVAAALAVLLTVIFVIQRFPLQRPEESGKRHVAVLPFGGLSDESQRPYADGLMEAITRRLSQIERLNTGVAGSAGERSARTTSGVRRRRAKEVRRRLRR